MYLLFIISGTTGLPKGVRIELDNVMNLRNWWVEYFSIQSDDRCMLFSSLSFIMSIRQWLPPLTKGASVTIPINALEFETAIVESKVNKLVCTPSALAALDGKTLCIGNPAANVHAYVVNGFGNQVPINCVGELWVSGSNVANGYLNRQTENDKYLSTDPFTNDGSRLYKTGDLCRRLEDGRIQFIGRRDKQIKLNGYRIEIGDIQGAMGPSVQSSHMLVQNGSLIAFVMPKVDVSEIKASLQDKLPTVSEYYDCEGKEGELIARNAAPHHSHINFLSSLAKSTWCHLT